MDSPASTPAQDPWSDAALAAARHVADPLADGLIEQLYHESGREFRRVAELLTHLQRNRDPVPEGFPDAVKQRVRQYFHESARPLETADADKLAAAEAFFARQPNLILFLFLGASLPECYLMGHGVQVLWRTQQLAEHTYRRLQQTTVLVTTTMSGGGFRPDGEGVRVAQRVRLMHAAMRHLILHTPPRPPGAAARQPGNFIEALQNDVWDTPRLGLPINQEDLAYTLLTFSYVILRGLDTLGSPPAAAEREAWLYCWNLTGRILGVREDLLAWTFADAARLFAAIQRRQARDTPEGRALTASLVRAVNERLPDDRALQAATPRLIRLLIGHERAEQLGLPAATAEDRAAQGFMKFLFTLIAALKRLLRLESPALVEGADKLLYRLLTAMPEKERQDLFRLPEHLAAQLPPKP